MKRLIWLIRLLIPYWPRILLALVLSVFTVTSHIGLMAASAYLLARAALHPPILDLMVTIVGVRFFGLSRAVFRYLERYLSHDVTFRVLSRIRVTFYEQIEPLAPARLSNYRSADLLSRIVGDVETQQNFYLRVFAPPLVAFLVLLGYGVFLARFDIRFSYILAAGFLMAGLLLPWLIKILGRGISTRIISLKAELNTQVADGLLGMTELLSYNQVSKHLHKIERTSNKIIEHERKLVKLSALSSSLMGLIANLGMLSVLVWGILLVEAGRLKGVDLGMLALGTLSSFEAIFPLAMLPNYCEENLAAADRLLELIENKHELNDKGDLLPPGNNLDLRFQDVSFRYNQDEPWVLKDLSLAISEGSKTAIVGPSGVGKTSIINLVLRFWEPEKGKIFLAEHSLPEYDLERLRDLFAVVSQQTYLFNATIKENLLLAKPSATDQELIEVAQQAQLHEFILSLPQGYDSYVGEGGLKLSGGQRQRLAIARVLLKNAPLIILDEAFASLDSLTESEVQREVFHLLEERTIILITHNILGLESMDEIMLLGNGRVIEQGTHTELLQFEGEYNELWNRARFVS
ncbi:putative multidrug export ATP-binding/permease protein [Desulfosporosinus acididurans]|uniref:Putative multidrug export ATP-binding/permease protein n=1 Tax=Desulfosporosinus acididurans TaxID=476652 RepID=A0A0J1IKI3_9FIRM|nr:thiol reductant ABC exporter subunit CydC [Desulfosporosinus acididurans]KLU65236.1 putative multidrug export ATP-binding/permease protein [Desulfosporosinus acididurans]